MPSNHSKISREEAKEALLRSGYLIESRVETVLVDASYYVEANASYSEPDSGRSRELDIYAISAEDAGPDEMDFVFPVLLVECINNDQPLVLLTKDPLVPFLYHYEVHVSGLPVKFRTDEEEWTSFADFLELEKFHHYCKGRVATQYCSFVKKRRNQEWMATHEEAHFDAFSQLCDALDYYQDKHYSGWSFGDDAEHLNVQLYYPILIIQGELLDGRASKRSVSLRRIQHLQFRRSVVSSATASDYQIDVIEERFLPKYLKMIDAEVSRIARSLRRRQDSVRRAIDEISAKAREAENAHAVRKAMEF